MIDDGVNEFYEVGPGNTLQGLIRKINREVIVDRI
jgi:[acyl-carrier-protein] S-malonyltransferase